MRSHFMLVGIVLACAMEAQSASSNAAAPTTAPATAGGTDSIFLTDVFSFRDQYRRNVSLDGEWEFRRDKEGVGRSRRWHEGEDRFTETIRIPGVPQAQGIGEPNSRQKSFFLEPFWVRRRFTLPALEGRQRVWLRLGGILPAAEVYLNGQYVGYTRSSRTQQRVDVTRFSRPGGENLVAVKVCDFPKVRLDGIWEMAECARNWMGVYAPVACEITDRVCVVDVYAQPQLASRSVKVTVNLSEQAGEALHLHCRVRDGQRSMTEHTIALAQDQKESQFDVQLDEFTAWSPNCPKLYELQLSLLRKDDGPPLDTVGLRFGMREISTKSTKFFLNGQPLFVRAFGENQYYPDTLCPPADKHWYLSRPKRAREYGMNAVKGCVEVLPQPYIEAADEAGIMIIQEMPFGLSELRANRYTIGPEFRQYYATELDGLVRESRNHPSVVAYSMSSEMEYPNQTQESFNFFSRDLVQQTRRLAPHALVIDCTGYLNGADTKKGIRDTDFYASIIPTWMKEVLDETPIATDSKHPTILHEYNWWSCYPDPRSRPLYDAGQFKPYWLDALLKTARENGQEELIPTYRRNSLWLQALGRKDGIEYARRCPNVEGYILWLLVDFGQYTEGLLDDFWNPKNVSPEEFLKSNGDTVIVLAKEGDRCLTAGRRATIPLAISHYGPRPLDHCSLQWRATIGADRSQEGELPVPRAECGHLTPAGDVNLDLVAVPNACKLTLQVTLNQDGKTINTNDWSFWVFPNVDTPWRDLAEPSEHSALRRQGIFVRTGETNEQIPATTPLVIADHVDALLADYIEGGGKCLLFSKGAVIENTAVYYGTTSFYRTFRTIPWNAGTSGNSGSVIVSHQALADFPHDEYCDLQLVWMVRDVLPMEFGPLRQYGVAPIIRMIDHYAANRNNAHLLEFKVGSGKVLATSLGVLSNAGKRVEARYLLRCLTRYAQGPAFAPTASVPREEFMKWFSQRSAESKPAGPSGLLR